MNELQNTLINYEEMLKSGMHFGRKKTVFNPKMDDYVFTVRDGICIIDLLKTQEKLTAVVSILRKVIEAGGTILFVAPTKQSTESTKALAEAINMPYVLDRWLGGTLTNFKVLSSRVKKLEEMEKQMLTGELDKYTKKERLMFERELNKMKTKFGGLKKLPKLPDLIFLSSLKEGALAVNEAKITGVKVISIANTDSDPTAISQVIPANDRSKKSVDLIIETIHRELVNTIK
jgi:small subunit ribosomal protein S2